EVAADESEFLDAALELLDAGLRRHTRRLRQLANSDEGVGVERADAMDHLVAHLRPSETDIVIADMVAHAHGARREDGHVGAALTLELELRTFEAFANLVIAGLQRRLGRLL